MSRKNVLIAQVLVSAVVAAGLGYVVACRYRGKRADALQPVENPLPAIEPNASASSAPTDLAKDIDELFGEELASGLEPTALLSERAPAPQSGDDAEAPAPEDLGRAWLTQATEAAPSVSSDLGVPAPDDLPVTIDEIGSQDDEANDPTVAEYIRRHRISSFG